tara:strand:- start:416 stop:736 length:321 start_codon:yes stop_codon:yes gene_type:complete
MPKAEVPLAELLIRRNDLKDKLERVKPLTNRDLYGQKVQRISVSDSVDEVTVQVPRLSYDEIDGNWNHISRQLRKVDALIQRTNWETQVAIDPELLQDYRAPALEN